jgi:hypothetical protein
MNESSRKARHPLSSRQRADQVLQILSFGVGLFLWLAWYRNWPGVGCVLPFIGNPAINVVVEFLPADFREPLNNSLVAAGVVAAGLAGAVWVLGTVLALESLTRWFEEEELKKVEAQAKRFQAARDRLERKRSNASIRNRAGRIDSRQGN